MDEALDQLNEFVKDEMQRIIYEIKEKRQDSLNNKHREKVNLY